MAVVLRQFGLVTLNSLGITAVGIAAVSAINLLLLPYHPIANMLLTPMPYVALGTFGAAAAAAYRANNLLSPQAPDWANFVSVVGAAIGTFVLTFYISFVVILNVKRS